MLFLLGNVALAQQARLCEDVYADIQRGLADPFASWLAWAPSERIVLADIFRCQEAWFRQQNAPATPEQAAAIHVLAGIKAFSDADAEQKSEPGAASVHFCAARAVRPDVDFPEEALPEDLVTWWRAPCDESPSQRLPPGPWVVDGTGDARDLPRRPDLRPYLFQQTDNGGEVVRSLVIAPGMAPPVVETPEGFAAARRGRTDWLAVVLTGAGASLAASGGVLVWQATTYGPERYSHTLSPDGWEAWRSDVLVPRRDAGLALVGAGTAALVGGTFSFAL